jgi:hypothetical protein
MQYSRLTQIIPVNAQEYHMKTPSDDHTSWSLNTKDATKVRVPTAHITPE